MLVIFYVNLLVQRLILCVTTRIGSGALMWPPLRGGKDASFDHTRETFERVSVA